MIEKECNPTLTFTDERESKKGVNFPVQLLVTLVYNGYYKMNRKELSCSESVNDGLVTNWKASFFNYQRRLRRSLTSSELANSPFAIFGHTLPKEFL